MNSVALAPSVAANSAENTRLIVLISCVATIGGFLFGFDSGVINGTVDGLKHTFHSTSAGIGFEVASMLLGCAIGAFFAGRLADRSGRRSVLIISAVLFLFSALGAGSATSAATIPTVHAWTRSSAGRRRRPLRRGCPLRRRSPGTFAAPESSMENASSS